MTRENILDYILSDLDLTLDEVINIIEFHLKDAPNTVKQKIKVDFKHAFGEIG